MATPADLIKKLVRRYRELREGRGLWNQHWEDLARVMHPSRLGFVTDQQEGDRRAEDIYDGTPLLAARGLANAIGAMLRPEGQDWWDIKAGDEEDGVDGEGRDWLTGAKKLYQEHLDRPTARFRQAMGECDKDLAVFGTGIVFTNERRELGGLIFQSIPLRDSFVLFNEYGEAIGIFRPKQFTLRQAEERFTRERLSEKTREKLQQGDAKLDEKIQFLHVVLPRKEGRPDALMARNFPFMSSWIEVEAEHEVEAGGFLQFPYAVPRWDTSSGEDYGRSPGMIALPDANTLQAMQETILIAGQRAAQPPLLVPNDGVFDAANTFPDGITYYDAEIAKDLGRIPIGPLETGGSLPITMDMQEKTREQVFAAFFRNVLNLPVEGPQMTAEEVRARKEEFIREIGPVFGRLETDYTAPVIERGFSIMLHAGAFGPVPESLAGRRVRFEYESPVKKLRKQIEAAAARIWVMERMELMAVDNSAMDIVDIDEYGRFSAEAAGVPEKMVLGDEVVARKRQARAQAQQQAAELQAAQVAAEAANKGAGAMKQMQEAAA
jgi:hypothetical protein